MASKKKKERRKPFFLDLFFFDRALFELVMHEYMLNVNKFVACKSKPNISLTHKIGNYGVGNFLKPRFPFWPEAVPTSKIRQRRLLATFRTESPLPSLFFPNLKSQRLIFHILTYIINENFSSNGKSDLFN